MKKLLHLYILVAYYSGRSFGDDTRLSISARAQLSCVYVECLHLYGSFKTPWDTPTSYNTCSTGFYFGRKEIFAWVDRQTKHATSWRVRNNFSKTMYKAKEIYRTKNARFCVLTVDDDSFWEGMEPLSVTELLPQLQEVVCSVGYTKDDRPPRKRCGNIYQFNSEPRLYDTINQLMVRSDLPCNDTLLGSPVISSDRDRLVGIISWCSNDSNDSEAYVLPVAFIYYVINSRDTELPWEEYIVPPFIIQPIQSSTMRTYYGLTQLEKNGNKNIIDVKGAGVRIQEYRNESAKKYVKLYNLKPNKWKNFVLQSGDILLKINEYKIYSDLTVKLSDHQSIGWFWALWNAQSSGLLRTIILRNGKIIEKKIAHIPVDLLVPNDCDLPHYLIYGGNVFQRYTSDLLGRIKLSSNLVEIPFRVIPKSFEGEEIVLWTNSLSTEMGYSPPDVATVVIAVNGVAVSNLKTFSELLKKSIETEKYVIIMLGRITSDAVTICSSKGPLHCNLRNPDKDGKPKVIQDMSCNLLIFDVEEARKVDQTILSHNKTSLAYGVDPIV